MISDDDDKKKSKSIMGGGVRGVSRDRIELCLIDLDFLLYPLF